MRTLNCGDHVLDAERIMITGGSYGGYMTLATAFHSADRIRCSLDVVGISHLSTFLKNTEDYRRDLRRVEYGDERDPKMAAFFEEIAPLNHTAEIKKPLFIVQGGNDPRVPASEAVQMKERIKQGGAPCGSSWPMMKATASVKRTTWTSSSTPRSPSCASSC